MFVYHDWGIAVYEPDECRLFHVIQGTDVIPGTQEYVCGDKGRSCSVVVESGGGDTAVFLWLCSKDDLRDMKR